MACRFLFGRGHGDSGVHGNRPWVYFMIDSFFLVTQFFVLTFKMRTGEDLVLPNKFPPGTICPHVVHDPSELKTMVAITINRDTPQSPPGYKINNGELLDQRGIDQKLNELAEGKRANTYVVRVAHEGKVIFDDVMPIFNACQRLGIVQCGLQPSRHSTK